MSIATGDNTAAVIAYDQTYGIEFPAISGVDGGTDICNAYGIGAYPTYILIAPSGQIVEQDMWPVSSANDLINPISGYGVDASTCGLSNHAYLLSYALPEQFEPATLEFGIVDVKLITNAAQNALVPTFTISPDATVAINGALQTSGTTAVDFTSGSAIYTVTAADGVTSLDWNVSVHNGLSVEPVAANLAAVFPNPTSDFVSFANATNVRFVNSLGQIVKVVDTPKGVISIQDLATGVYTLRIETNNKIENHQLLIQR